MDLELDAWLKEIAAEPENTICFDCGVKNPNLGWASVNNGVFLCLSCMGFHRRHFGVHISCGRSIFMDRWAEKQVRNMAVGGNRRAAEYFQARNYDRKGQNIEHVYQSDVFSEYRALLNGKIEKLIDDKAIEVKKESGPPNLFVLATQACIKLGSLNERFIENDLDFLRPRVIDEMARNNLLMNNNIQLIRGNYITSLNLNGESLLPTDIVRIAESCPELKSFGLHLFIRGNLANGLHSLLSLCPKLETLKIEYSWIRLDPVQDNAPDLPFTAGLQVLSLKKSSFANKETTYPALEDILCTCINLKALILTLNENGEVTESKFPFVRAIRNYNDIVVNSNAK